jgi:hypothetical protein
MWSDLSASTGDHRGTSRRQKKQDRAAPALAGRSRLCRTQVRQTEGPGHFGRVMGANVRRRWGHDACSEAARPAPTTTKHNRGAVGAEPIGPQHRGEPPDSVLEVCRVRASCMARLCQPFRPEARLSSEEFGCDADQRLLTVEPTVLQTVSAHPSEWPLTWRNSFGNIRHVVGAFRLHSAAGRAPYVVSEGPERLRG